MSENLTLIALVTDILRGEKSLRRMLQQLQTFGIAVNISNVYRRDQSQGEIQSELIAVVLLQTSCTKDEMFQHVSELKSLATGSETYGSLLTYNQAIQLVPHATLPDPRLLKDRLWLQCAAEVWGNYEHPIVAKSLNQILKSKLQQDERVEFFAQGRVLL